MAENENNRGFWEGLFVGGVLGAIAGLLFAPRSGKELRSELKQWTELLQEGKELYLEAQAKAKTILEQAQRQAEDLKKEADLQLKKAKELINESKTEAKQMRGAVKAGLRAVKQEYSRGTKRDEGKS